MMRKWVLVFRDKIAIWTLMRDCSVDRGGFNNAYFPHNCYRICSRHSQPKTIVMDGSFNVALLGTMNSPYTRRERSSTALFTVLMRELVIFLHKGSQEKRCRILDASCTKTVPVSPGAESRCKPASPCRARSIRPRTRGTQQTDVESLETPGIFDPLAEKFCSP